MAALELSADEKKHPAWVSRAFGHCRRRSWCVASNAMIVAQYISWGPRLRPRRYAPRNTSPRRQNVDLQATAFSPTPTRAEEHIALTPGYRPAGHRTFANANTRRAPRWAADRAPPRPRPPAHAEENFARRRAADLAALRAVTHADCAEEIATRPRASCPRQRVRRNASP